MPSLIAHHKRQVVETRLARFYSVINQAITMSKVENGDTKDWLPIEDIFQDGTHTPGRPSNSISAEKWFNMYLSKYLKVIKVESNKTLERKCDLYFPDGSMVTFSGSSWIFYPEAKDYKVALTDKEEIYDRNRKDSGKKNFTFKFYPDCKIPHYYNKGVEPFMYCGNGYVSDSTLKNNSNIGCYVDAENERAYCTELIRRNGWKIPDDYPWFK